MRDASFNKTIRQCSLKTSTDSVNYVFNKAYELFTCHYKWKEPLRSIGIRVDRLDSLGQHSLMQWDDCNPVVDITSHVKSLTNRFGLLSVEKSATAKEMLVSADVIQP